MSVGFRRTLFAGSVLAGVIAAGASQAQTTAANTIEEIVVTANRVESLASKTPIAVTAVSGEGLASGGITNPTQLSEAVPNLTIHRGNGLQITIRGVTSTDGTEKGDPSASFLSDGLYIARPQAQEVSFFDIGRVEVLRGPQGTLYGRNTTAGVVNILSALPTQDFGGSLDVNLGNYNARQVTGVLNLPINDDLALRIAGNYDARDTYVKQGVPQAVGTPKYKNNTSLRISALYRPDDRLSARVVLDSSQIYGYQQGPTLQGFYQLPLLPAPAGLRGIDPVYVDGGSDAQLTKMFADVQRGVNHDRTLGALGDVTFALTDNWSLTWLGGYREFERDDKGNTFRGNTLSATGQITGATTFPNTFLGEYDQVSHEVRAAYNGDRLDFQAGLYYFREEYDIFFFFVGFLGGPGQRGYIFGFPQAGWAKTVAGFGQATYSVTDRWRVTAGVRQTKDDKYRNGATIFHTSISDPKNFSPPVSDSLNLAELEKKKLTWKLSTDFDLTPTTMAYATVSTGYKAGGFNDGCLAGNPGCNAPLPAGALFYQPETITAFEVGLKAGLMDNRLRLTTSYFHYDYKNLQLSQLSNICGGPCQVTTNAAKAKVDGIELEGVMAIDERNRLDFSATWLDARYADWPLLPTFNLAGFKLDRSPEWTFRGGYTYTHPLEGGATLAANINSRYSDRYAMLSTTLRAQFWQPSFTKTDVTLTYNSASNAWRVQGYVRNLENNIELLGAAQGGGFPALNNGGATIGDPRTYGARLSVQF